MRLAHGDHTTWPRLVGAIVLGTLCALGSASAEGRTRDPGGLSATLSGLPSSPRGERSLRVADGGVGIRFRAPVTARLTTVYTYWRASGACRLTLFVEGRDVPLLAV